MDWVSASSRILLVTAGCTVLGWYFGYPLMGVLAGLLGLVLYWTYQMVHLQHWLQASDGTPPAVYGIWGDITARIYKHQREAGQTEQRLQSLVDYLLESFASLRDGVVIVEQQGGIRWCNDAATRMLGLRYPEDTGQAITNLVRQPRFNEYVTAGDYEQPLQFYTDGEQKLHLQVEITRFADDDSLLFVRDVTERIRLEQMRRDFVGNVSHELRTPLTVISGYLGAFLSDSEQLPPAYLKPLRQMEQQADRMENLLKDLLWLSRIESDEQEEKREDVDMTALLKELREEIATTQPQRRLVLNLVSGRQVCGDYRQLYSAASNLTFNALKYSPQESPVEITWREQGGKAQLVVRDQGIGIEAMQIPRLTERFYRVDDSRSSASGGTGLGLAIVKHVAVAHGARLQISSEPGSGSTFTLEFP